MTEQYLAYILISFVMFTAGYLFRKKVYKAKIFINSDLISPILNGEPTIKSEGDIEVIIYSNEIIK